MPQVPFADTSGSVALRFEELSHSEGSCIQPAFAPGEKYGPNAIPYGVLPGKQPGTGGRTNRRSTVKVSIAYALCSEFVQVWGMYAVGTIAAEVSVPQVISVDEDDIWPLGFVGLREAKARDQKEKG
jgi:hypothetical protein